MPPTPPARPSPPAGPHGPDSGEVWGPALIALAVALALGSTVIAEWAEVAVIRAEVATEKARPQGVSRNAQSVDDTGHALDSRQAWPRCK